MGKTMSLIFQQLFEAESSTYPYPIPAVNAVRPYRLIRSMDPGCGNSDWEHCAAKLPVSNTTGLICPAGGECMPLESALTNSGYDAVVLEDGLKGLGDHWGRLPATQAGGASSLKEGTA